MQVDAANVKALFLRGSTFFKKRAYHEALSDFSNLLRREPRHVEGLYHRGRMQPFFFVASLIQTIFKE